MITGTRTKESTQRATVRTQLVTAEEARQGKELGVMRYVLHISLGLAVLAGIAIGVIYM